MGRIFDNLLSSMGFSWFVEDVLWGLFHGTWWSLKLIGFGFMCYGIWCFYFRFLY